MPIVQFIIEVLFYAVCGWVGHVVVRVVTFGKVKLDWGESAESILTEWIGFFFLLGVAILVATLVQE